MYATAAKSNTVRQQDSSNSFFRAPKDTFQGFGFKNNPPRSGTEGNLNSTRHFYTYQQTDNSEQLGDAGQSQRLFDLPQIFGNRGPQTGVNHGSVAGTVIQRAKTFKKQKPKKKQDPYQISHKAAAEMISPIPRNTFKNLTGRVARSGIRKYDVGSYGAIQYLEKQGDQLTGDHQPSGAALKEAIRQILHQKKQGPLTRQSARNAYKRGITFVMPEKWHREKSRTYGGRNTKNQISNDASNLKTAADNDWIETEKELKASGESKKSIALHKKRLRDSNLLFFKYGKPQFKPK